MTRGHTDRFDLTVLGELLIDFTYHGLSESGMRLFEQNAGGAVANAVVAAARQGNKTAFIGKVGADMHGQFLRDVLAAEGVCTDGLVTAEDVFTTLAFVALTEQGERSFSFARKPGADTWMRADEVDERLLRRTRVFHIGSLSLTQEPARSATWHALRAAKDGGAIISYDPNYRASLWESESAAVEQMRSLLPVVDMMKLSDEETELVTDFREPEQALAHLLRLGITCAAVTLGARGALLCLRGHMIRIPAYPCRVTDTTGAGDAFWGGFLSGFLRSEKPLEALTPEDVHTWGRYGAATAALCIGKRGGIPAMPTLAQVEALVL